MCCSDQLNPQPKAAFDQIPCFGNRSVEELTADKKCSRRPGAALVLVGNTWGGGPSMKLISAIAASALLFSGCAISPKNFYDAPEKAKVISLCRAVFESEQKYDQQQFARDVQAELEKRGVTRQQCVDKVNTENALLAVTAVAVTGVAVAAACNNGCAGGGYQPTYVSNDVDCYGGSGNGPRWQYGPINVGSYDPYGLDADHDGVGCEVSDIGYGA